MTPENKHLHRGKKMGVKGLFDLALKSKMRSSGWNLEPDTFKLET